ncbi:MAG: hypothetical protein JRH09_13675 [Deltaproteobacteria bacterium]|nr:hypothetical protein [Deltaproteobacteria bacterium]
MKKPLILVKVRSGCLGYLFCIHAIGDRVNKSILDDGLFCLFKWIYRTRNDCYLFRLEVF